MARRSPGPLCSTIYFHKGADTGTDVGPDQFHHIMLVAIEVSEPVNLKKRCDDEEWATVKTEQTFLTGLVHGFVAPLYTPWGVAWKCKQKSRAKSQIATAAWLKSRPG